MPASSPFTVDRNMFNQFRNAVKRCRYVILKRDHIAFPEPEKSVSQPVLPETFPGNLKTNGQAFSAGEESYLMIANLQKAVLQLMAANCGWDVNSAGNSSQPDRRGAEPRHAGGWRKAVGRSSARGFLFD